MNTSDSSSLTDLGIPPKRLVSLVEGLQRFELPEERMVTVLIDQFAMNKPRDTEHFWECYEAIKSDLIDRGVDPEHHVNSASLNLVLSKVIRMEKRSGHFPEMRHPDYSRLRRYEASPEELSAAGLKSVDEMVRRINAYVGTKRKFTVTQFDFPSSKSKFERLVETLKKLDAQS